MIEAYFRQVKEGLNKILSTEAEKLEEASKNVAQAITDNGVIHIFGCGHSHMMAEEAFYRAGGLVPVNPILFEPLMLHEGALRSSKLERQEEYGNHILKDYQITDKDIFFVVSTSGRNPVPIDVANTAKDKGCFVIALTSFEYSKLGSRHKSGKHLSESVNLAINTQVEVGDAVMKHKLVKSPFTSVSSIHNIAIMNAIFAQAIVLVAENGGNPPIFLSGNVDNADEHNLNLINSYKEKIPLFSLE
jgi:uncharacterized phosphosugar-binding protein